MQDAGKASDTSMIFVKSMSSKIRSKLLWDKNLGGLSRLQLSKIYSRFYWGQWLRRFVQYHGRTQDLGTVNDIEDLARVMVKLLISRIHETYSKIYDLGEFEKFSDFQNLSKTLEKSVNLKLCPGL